MKQTWLDVYLGKYKWYRKLRGGKWYKHENTYQLPGLFIRHWWARYGNINRYSKVINEEQW